LHGVAWRGVAWHGIGLELGLLRTEQNGFMKDMKLADTRRELHLSHFDLSEW
jgi:hypothetical protein